MVNDFEEFALQFRRRTAARLLEFEANLEKAQRDVEQAVAEQASQKAARARAHTQRKAPKQGQVRSVLRRD